MGNLKSTSATGNFKQEIDNMDCVPCDIYLPQEVLISILSFVDPDTLIFSCRLVCKQWKEIIESSDLWRTKLFRENRDALKINNITCRGQLAHPWYMYYALCKHNAFGKNFVKNPCGKEKFEYWQILSHGGDKWKVEKTPAGADPLPHELQKEGYQSCFATSYMWCTKDQLISLYAGGLNKKIMESKPPIHVSDWYAGRFDCGCVYKLTIELVDGEGMVEPSGGVKVFDRRVEQWEGRKWHKVSHTFVNYPPNIRFVKITRGGKDTQFWAGHYGSKMAGANVHVTLPVLMKDESVQEDIE